MVKFLIRRAVFAVFSLLAATVIVFGLSRAAGDPLDLYALQAGHYGMSPEQRADLIRYLRLDKPLVMQYFLWLGDALRGNLGEGLLDRIPVVTKLRSAMGASAQLAVGAWLFAVITGVPLGILSAVKRGGIWDYFGRGFALFGQALPQFWIGLVAILVFSVQLGWLPSYGRGNPTLDWFSQIKHFILPTITLGWLGSASYLRLTRSSMLEVMDSEYVKLARAKGVNEIKVIWKHCFRNALIAPITYSALFLAGFISGATVVELVFSWPGIGRLALQAVGDNNFPVLTGTVLFWAAVFVLFSFIADVLYGFVDPRIRYA